MMVNASTSPPTLRNPVGLGIQVVGAVMLVILTAVVAMRLWGRYRYKAPDKSTKATFREPRFWMLVSDGTIILSYISAVALTAVQMNAVQWGQGLHVRQLSIVQIHAVLKMFFIYQVLYKFCSAIAKMATVFLFLAISTPHKPNFNLVCKAFATYMGLYCLACSLVAVFQCGTKLESNWNKTVDQSHCFYLPPFWYAHAIINVSATLAMAILPWWLFAHISYKRKYAIATVMTVLALAETGLGAVRLWSLYRAAKSPSDLTYSTSTGQIVSQLEVDFATIASCIPTVLKIGEEAWNTFCVRVLGRTPDFSTSRTGSKTTGTHETHASELQSIDRGPRPTGPYASFDRDDESTDSQDVIVKRSSRAIKVTKEVEVAIEYGFAETRFSRQDEQEDGLEGGKSSYYVNSTSQ
ncbi:uncharacterized protein BCR38DRAFT_228838 [Pseudomassariella vexata]|uniref:Rhodopsin domain-containing protein n=1 Tax=Pseudomassariella vexata TaxID=1141098 RepID=A0A1Y2DW35_9PEZI|nr:uncharacterized protein BCR38DRAFT_228838 [Pseudomassariella vexata]ORY63467.1 hypothetical protein BCR38DRAFT_228838 [Pseudomassariella vexata]